MLPVTGGSVGVGVVVGVAVDVAVAVGVAVDVPVAVDVDVAVDEAVAVGVLFVVVGDTTRWVVVALGDFDGDGKDRSGVGSRLSPGMLPLIPLPADEVVADAVGLCEVDAELCVVGVVDLVAPPGCALPLLEISTATMATTPMTAAPIPANNRLRDGGRLSSGIR